MDDHDTGYHDHDLSAGAVQLRLRKRRARSPRKLPPGRGRRGESGQRAGPAP
jgi:hypothetical protein